MSRLVPPPAPCVPEDLSLVNDAHDPMVRDVLGTCRCGHIQSEAPSREDIFPINLAGISGHPAVDVPDDGIGYAVPGVMEQLEEDLPAPHHGLHQVIPADIPGSWRAPGRFSVLNCIMNPLSASCPFGNLLSYIGYLPRGTVQAGTANRVAFYEDVFQSWPRGIVPFLTSPYASNSALERPSFANQSS